MNSVREGVARLFEGASGVGLTDGELLGRFATRRDESAFSALVDRLGPMVLGVCRRMLADPHDVDDAFQATFLVLVRRAHSIRDRELVAPWLHGVAVRVARRARAESARRSSRGRVGLGEFEPASKAESRPEGGEVRSRIDEEIGRLSEHHRRAVVLCDVEGLSREEAAQRLGWSLNMLRGRLERARNQLRGRLARRGLAPSGSWLGLLANPATSAFLASSTARVAVSAGGGRLVSGIATASAVALSRGTLRMMMLSKLKVAATVALSSGMIAAGAGMIAAQGPGDGPAAKRAPAEKKADAAPADDFAELGQKRLERAKKRWEAQKAFYEEGRITVDRLLDASDQWMRAQVDLADTPRAKTDAKWAHVDRIKDVLRRERTKLEAGRATQADLAEIETRLDDIVFEIAKEARAARSKPAEARLDSPSDPLVLPPPGVPADPRGPSRARSGRPPAPPTPPAPPAPPTVPSPGDPAPPAPPTPPTPPSTSRAGDAADLAVAVEGAKPGRAMIPVGGPDPFALGDPTPTRGMSLARAIEDSNKEAGGYRAKGTWDQEPLTEDEVVAAIRRWENSWGYPFPAEPYAEFKRIAETRRLPVGASIALESGGNKAVGEYLYQGSWVSIRLLIDPDDDDTILFPIRERLVRSMPLRDAVARLESLLRDGKDLDPAYRARIEDELKGYKAALQQGTTPFNPVQRR